MNQGTLTITGWDETAQVVQAEYSKRNDWYYVLYKENTEAFMGVSSRLKIREGYLELVRNTKQNLRMVYEAGKEFCMRYPTPYGDLDLTLRTKRVHLQESEESLQVIVEYDMNTGEEDSPEMTLKILLKKK